MFASTLYGIALVWLPISLMRDREKTKQALKKAWRSFENMLPSVLAVLMLASFILVFLDEKTISTLIGIDSGVWGMMIAAVVGSVTLIPGFVAFPLAASLVAAGAGYGQIAVFISTLMMVGVATLPLEISFFGRHAAIKRNVLALVSAFITSCVIGVIM